MCLDEFLGFFVNYENFPNKEEDQINFWCALLGCTLTFGGF